MVNYFIYAKDYSASTDGTSFYHENALKTVDQFKSDVKKIQNELSKTGGSSESRIVYLHWGHICTEEDEETIIREYEDMIGKGNNTLPETIVQWIKSNLREDVLRIELLYIITDGLIDSRSMDKCMQENSDMQYENVVFHAFNRDFRQINLSVAATFLKSRCMIYRNNELLDDTDISEQFDYGKITLQNFETEKENLKSYIRLKYITKIKADAVALKEIDELKKLRNRLFEELSEKSSRGVDSLDTKDRSIFLQKFVATEWYRYLNSPVRSMKMEIEKCISTLINYINSEKKSYSFDALKFDTKYDNAVEEEEVVDVNFAPEQEIEFPDIILNDDKGIPVILLTKFNLLDKIIFHKTSEAAEALPASFNKFRSAMDCPLLLLNDPDISESIGYFYTLNVYKQFLENDMKTEPRTRRPFHGGLVLTDTEQFDKYNDYILSATYFDFKKIKYNVGLFYYVLWKNCESKEWMDKNVVEQFKKFVMRRISTTVCKIGLSSLPLDPNEDTSLLTALWYCVELSSCIFKHDPLNFIHERLRMYYKVADSMIEILKYFDYDLDLESIEKRRDLIRHVMILKRIPTHPEKKYFLVEKIFKNVNGFLICEIEKPSNVNKLNYLQVNPKSMLRDDVIEGKVNLTKYVHFMHYQTETDVKICDRTFRPFFTIDENKSFYTELVKITSKVTINNDEHNNIKITFDAVNSLEFDKILSLYNLFIRCVVDSRKYPTFPEYLEYVLKKKKFKGGLVTIFPSNAYTCAERVYRDYQSVIANVNVDKFMKACQNYVNRVDRVKAEEVVKFSNDNAINQYVSSEELKVNLKKKIIN